MHQYFADGNIIRTFATIKIYYFNNTKIYDYE